MTNRIELILKKLDDSKLQREILVNGKSVFYQVFDKKFIDKDDFIHQFSDKVLNGLHDKIKSQS